MDAIRSRPVAMLVPGSVVAHRFEVVQQAGSGGMARVFRALDLETGGTVALKVLHGTVADDAARFEREAVTLAGLRHPGIVGHVAHGATDDGQPYLAMEWVDGEDLRARIARGPLRVDETLALGARVAEALGEAHTLGILHRDVKPENLLLPGGRVEEVKVADFGIARDSLQSYRPTRTGVLLGTPGYMAPEQAQGRRGIDARADVFALGCVLFECLTGQAAFSGDHVLAVLAKVVLQETPRVREHAHGVPDALEELVARMMAKEPTSRPADGAAAAAELRAHARGVPETAAVPQRRAITAKEQRLLSVVLARPAAEPSGLDDTVWSPPDGALEDVLQPVRMLVTSHGGTLVPLAGGTLVATLAESGAATDLASGAARMVLSLRPLLRGWSFALATGRATVDGRTPVGEAVDRAVSLLDSQGGIRLDQVTASLLPARFEVADGELRAEREAHEEPRTLLGRPTRTVGRDRDLVGLRALFDECASEPVARAVLVTGPAGIGKSRLRRDVLRDLDGRAVVFMGRGDPLRVGSSYGVLGPAIRRACGILDGEPLEVRRARVAARVGRTVAPGELLRVSRFLGELVGAPSAADDVQLRAARQDARLMGDQMRRAFEDFLAAECAAGPVALVLEDLHWGDAATVSAIDSALRLLRDRPLFVLALARPEVHESFPRLWAERELQEVRLGGLTRSASERLVREVLGDDVPADRVRFIVERAAGNAFFLEELIRAEDEGRGDVAVPSTVLAMTQSRLDALSAVDRRILRAGSVFGRVFWRGGVAALLGAAVDEQELGARLGHLVRSEMLSAHAEARFPGEQELAFRHDIVREAAYQMLVDDDRALGHRLAAEWLERSGETDSSVMAEHCARGGALARAAHWYARAAREAIEGGDLTAALEQAGRGVACGATGDGLGGLRLLEAEAYHWRGENAVAHDRALAAMQLLPAGSEEWLRAAGHAATTSGKIGDRAGLLFVGEALLTADIPADHGGAALIAAAHVALALIHSGQYDHAGALMSRIEETVSPHAEELPAAAGRLAAVQGCRAAISGDLVEAVRWHGSALEQYERAGDARAACQARSNLGYSLIEIGEHERAVPLLREAVAVARRMGLLSVCAHSQSNLGLALARAGAIGEALSVEAEAAETLGRQGDRRLEGSSRHYLAEILGQAGDWGAAEREARRAMEVAAGTPSLRACALATLIGALLAQGRQEEALERAHEATRILEGLGGLDEGESLVRCRAAEALLVCGDPGAHAAVRQARDRLVVSAGRIAEAGQRERFLTRVPANAGTLALARRIGLE